MPTLIRLASSTEEIEDVLSLRYALLEGFHPSHSTLQETSRKLIDPIDLYPETRNLLAYQDGKPVGTARFLLHRSNDPLLHGPHDFSEASRSVPGPVAYLDWLGVQEGVRDHARILEHLLEYGLLSLAQKSYQTVLGCLPLSDHKDRWMERFSATPLSSAFSLSPQSQWLPVSIALSTFYEHWVSQIQDREILRFQTLFYYTLFEAGDVIFVQGERGSTAYLIQEGEVAILLKKGDSLIPIGTLQGNQLIGEIGMITQEPRTASLVAKTPVTCITLERQAFLDTLDQKPHLSMDVFKIFSKRVQQANQKIAQSTSAPMSSTPPPPAANPEEEEGS